LTPSIGGPASLPTAPDPAVARLVSPRYLPASSWGIKSVANAQLALKKMPAPAPITPPKMSSVVTLWLRVSLGPVFIPRIPLERSGRDRAVARQVMNAIARQLDIER
jgi:hypothetical protein